MVAGCEDELICDMAEVYHILNWRELPVRLSATLACGLDADSRVKRKLAGDAPRLDLMLQAAILDQLQILRWYQTADGQKGKNPPKLMVETLQNSKKTKPKASISGKEFDSRWREIVGG